MGKIELKPCPFCGCQPDVLKHPKGWVVSCGNCSKCMAVVTAPRSTMEHAANIWNTRHERTCHTEPAKGTALPLVACSECGEEWHHAVLFNYCPHCGCKVVS